MLKMLSNRFQQTVANKGSRELKLKELDTHVAAYSERYWDAGSIPAASIATPGVLRTRIQSYKATSNSPYSYRSRRTLVLPSSRKIDGTTLSIACFFRDLDKMLHRRQALPRQPLRAT